MILKWSTRGLKKLDAVPRLRAAARFDAAAYFFHFPVNLLEPFKPKLHVGAFDGHLYASAIAPCRHLAIRVRNSSIGISSARDRALTSPIFHESDGPENIVLSRPVLMPIFFARLTSLILTAALRPSTSSFSGSRAVLSNLVVGSLLLPLSAGLLAGGGLRFFSLHSVQRHDRPVELIAELVLQR